MAFSNYNYGINTVAKLAQGVVIKKTSNIVSNITIDSRLKVENSLFVCLKGQNTDGHSYILNAIKNGASVLLIKTSEISKIKSQVKNIDVGIIAVESPLCGLQNIAKNYIKQFSNINYTAITGSVGKSTTKQALAALLSTSGNTVFTPSNYNSEIGLPLVLLQVDKDIKYGVFEMGIDHIGEMDRHLYMLKPQQAIITNIGYSHVEKLGSIQNIAKEKGKIFHENLDIALLSKNCKYKKILTKNLNSTALEYSYKDVNFFDNGLLGMNIKIDNEIINLPIIGEYQLEDIVAAITLSRKLGLDNKQIINGLHNFKPMPGRGSIFDGSITVIEDCYNASPSSTNYILNYIKRINWIGNKKVVLGSMKELGSRSLKAHISIAKSIYKNNLESVFLYGNEMESAYRYLINENYSSNLFYSDNFEELKYEVQKNKQNGDLFLLKGSRAMAIERLIPTLQGVC